MNQNDANRHTIGQSLGNASESNLHSEGQVMRKKSQIKPERARSVRRDAGINRRPTIKSLGRNDTVQVILNKISNSRGRSWVRLQCLSRMAGGHAQAEYSRYTQ